ncbi:MAG: low temperature requirement protein A [Thermoleophilaceae bacterium]
MAEEAAAGPGPNEEAEERVTPLELFFDLVFVFAITQFIADDPSWGGMARGMLILALVWWAWVGYSWLTNWLDTEADRTRLAIFAAMAAMFVVSLAIPGAFSDDAVVFAFAYAFVRVLHILLFAYASNDVDIVGATKRFAPAVGLSLALIFTAAFLDGPVQGVLWTLAVLIDCSGALLGGSGWKLHPTHFAERHGLIVIIAFGESIVATGLGASETTLTLGVVAERRLKEAPHAEQVSMARDSYSYIHLLLIAGIVLLALGMKKTIGDIGEPLKTVPAVALCGGVALYLLGHVAFRLRNIGTLNKQRVVVASIATALILPATRLDALVTVTLLAVLTAGLITYEAIRFSEARQRIRASVHA